MYIHQPASPRDQLYFNFNSYPSSPAPSHQMNQQRRYSNSKPTSKNKFKQLIFGSSSSTMSTSAASHHISPTNLKHHVTFPGGHMGSRRPVKRPLVQPPDYWIDKDVFIHSYVELECQLLGVLSHMPHNLPMYSRQMLLTTIDRAKQAGQLPYTYEPCEDIIVSLSIHNVKLLSRASATEDALIMRLFLHEIESVAMVYDCAVTYVLIKHLLLSSQSKKAAATASAEARLVILKFTTVQQAEEMCALMKQLMATLFSESAIRALLVSAQQNNLVTSLPQTPAGCDSCSNCNTSRSGSLVASLDASSGAETNKVLSAARKHQHHRSNQNSSIPHSHSHSVSYPHGDVTQANTSFLNLYHPGNNHHHPRSRPVSVMTDSFVLPNLSHPSCNNGNIVHHNSHHLRPNHVTTTPDMSPISSSGHVQPRPSTLTASTPRTGQNRDQPESSGVRMGGGEEAQFVSELNEMLTEDQMAMFVQLLEESTTHSVGKLIKLLGSSGNDNAILVNVVRQLSTYLISASHCQRLIGLLKQQQQQQQELGRNNTNGSNSNTSRVTATNDDDSSSLSSRSLILNNNNNNNKSVGNQNHGRASEVKQKRKQSRGRDVCVASGTTGDTTFITSHATEGETCDGLETTDGVNLNNTSSSVHNESAIPKELLELDCMLAQMQTVANSNTPGIDCEEDEERDQDRTPEVHFEESSSSAGQHLRDIFKAPHDTSLL